MSQTLTFLPGDTSASFPVMALADQIDELQEQFPLSLSNPSSNAMLGAASTATVFINDTNSKSLSANHTHSSTSKTPLPFKLFQVIFHFHWQKKSIIFLHAKSVKICLHILVQQIDDVFGKLMKNILKLNFFLHFYIALLVDFVPAAYSVKEGDAVNLTAMLNIPADRDVSVIFSTVPGTASDGNKDVFIISRSFLRPTHQDPFISH